MIFSGKVKEIPVTLWVVGGLSALSLILTAV